MSDFLREVVEKGLNAPSGERICTCHNPNAVKEGLETPCWYCELHAALASRPVEAKADAGDRALLAPREEPGLRTVSQHALECLDRFDYFRDSGVKLTADALRKALAALPVEAKRTNHTDNYACEDCEPARPAPADALRERALRESAKEGIWEGLWKCEMCGKTGSPDWYEMVKGGSHYTNNGNCSGRLVHLERRALLAPHEEAPGSVVGHCEKCGEINITTVTQTGPNEGKHYNARTKEMCGPVRWEAGAGR